MGTTLTPDPGAAPSEAPDAALVEFLGGEVESPAPAAVVEPSAPAVPAPSEPAAQPRDDQGRFTTPETPAGASEPAVEVPPVAPPAETPTESKPFSYRAYGAEHAPFAGAIEVPDGVFVPTPAVPQLRQILAEGHQAESRRRQAEHEREGKLTSARTANATLVERADLTLRRLAELRKDPETLQAWFQDLDRN